MIVIALYVSFVAIWHARSYNQSHTTRDYEQASDTECSAMVVAVDATQQNHHEYDHEYITDKNVRIALAIFTNYPRHLSEVPSPLLRITLAIQQWRFKSPSPLIKFSLAIWVIFQRDYRNTRQWILEIMYPCQWWHYCWSHELHWLVRIH